MRYAIGEDKSVVSREIKRNKDQRNGVYRYKLVQRKSVNRQQYKSQPRKINQAIIKYIENKLKQDLNFVFSQAKVFDYQ